MKMNFYSFMLMNSKWPLLVSINSLLLMMNVIFLTLKLINYKYLLLTMLILVLSMNNWVKNIFMEKSLIGFQSLTTSVSYKPFIILIILSEMMFFSSFFYVNFTMNKFLNSFYNFNLKSIINLNFILSFLNLMILLTSSLTFMMFMNFVSLGYICSIKYINLTIVLGIYFSMIQFTEYKTLCMNISNSIYYSNFFLLTFFHMNHVIMGIITMILMNLNFHKMLNSAKSSFMMVCWYWHFIDLIWLMIFILIY